MLIHYRHCSASSFHVAFYSGVGSHQWWLWYIYVFFFLIKKNILQCFVCSCHMIMQTSHNYTYIPSPSSLSPLPASYPSRSSEYQTGLPVIHSNFPHPSILYPIMYTCWCYFFHLALTLPPKLCPQVHSLHLHLLSFPSDRFIDIIFLDYMCVCVSVLIYYVSFPDLLHYVQQALGPLKLTEIHSFFMAE